MEKRFKFKATEKLESYIGIELKNENDYIYLSQENYINKVIKYYELELMKKRNIPLTTYEENNISNEKMEDLKNYQSIVGILNYLTNSTRFDIGYSVNW